jgi:hypothetical protein
VERFVEYDEWFAGEVEKAWGQSNGAQPLAMKKWAAASKHCWKNAPVAERR